MLTGVLPKDPLVRVSSAHVHRLALAFLLLAFLIAPTARSVDYTVSCGGNPGEDLRAAIRNANVTGGTITLLGCQHVFVGPDAGGVDSALPQITGVMTIVGNGDTIRRDPAQVLVTAPYFRLFYVAPGGGLTLKNVILSEGYAPSGPNGFFEGDRTGQSGHHGGAIDNHGTLVVDGVTFIANQAGFGGSGINCNNNTGSSGGHTGYDGGPGGNGGAIRNVGTLTVKNSTFKRDGTTEPANRGGIGGKGGNCTGTELFYTARSAGSGGRGGLGGAIYNDAGATLLIQNSKFFYNQGGRGGDTGDTAGSNSAALGGAGGDGGAIYSAGTLTIEDSTIHGNNAGMGGTSSLRGGAGGYGGGGVASGGLTVRRSSFTRNISGLGGSGNQGAGGGGGGLVVGAGATIESATFSNNQIANSCPANHGAAIYARSTASLQLRNVTFESNFVSSCSVQSGTGNSTYVELGGTARMWNSIFHSVTTLPLNCAGAGTYVDETPGANITWSVGGDVAPLSGDKLGCPATFLSANPKLGIPSDALIGPMAIPPDNGSPAVEGGANIGCAALDIRGVARPQGSRCDIGSYEWLPVAVTAHPADVAGIVGSLVSFSASSSGYGTPTAKWERSTDGSTWIDIPNTLTTGTSTTHSRIVQMSDLGSRYRAVFTDAIGTVRTNSAALTVRHETIVSNLPSEIRSNVGATFYLHLEFDANPAVTLVTWQVSKDRMVSWTNLFDPQPGSTHGDMTFSFVATNEMHQATVDAKNWRYRVILSGGYPGRLDKISNVPTLYVSNDLSSPEFLTQLLKSVVAEGFHTLQFSARVSGNPPPTIGWQYSADGGQNWTNIFNRDFDHLDSDYAFNTVPNGGWAELFFPAAANQDDHLFRGILNGVVTSQANYLTVRVPATTTLDCPPFAVAGSPFHCTAAVTINPAEGPRERKPCGEVAWKHNGTNLGNCTLDATGACSMAFDDAGALGSQNTIEALYAGGGQELCSDGKHFADINTNIFVWESATVTSAACALPDLLCLSPATAVGDSSCIASVPDMTNNVPVSSPGCSYTVTQSPAAGSLVGLGQHEVTLTVTNDVGSESCTTTFTVTDGTLPVIVLNGDNPMTVSCNTPYIEPGAVSTDACDGTRGVGIQGSVDTSISGTYTLLYLSSDPAGNQAIPVERTVIVVDDTPPVITLIGPSEIMIPCNPPFAFQDPGATAVDACEGDVPVVPSGTYDVNAPGTYTITYEAKDSSGNTAQITRALIVVGSGTPEIVLNGPDVITHECHTPFLDPGATADDVCSGNVAVSISGSVDVNVPGSYTLTYSAPAANSITRTVNVVDTTKPVIALNGASTVTLACKADFSDPGATASDTCDASVPVIAVGSVNTNIPGSYTITYTASDDSGNAATPVIRTVSVVDTLSPVISLNGAAILTVECHTSFNDPGATAVDACAGSFAATASGTVDVNTPGSYTVTYDASDPSGNAAAPVTRTVNVVDTTEPSITLNGLSSITHECHTAFTDSGATATDSCAGTLSVQISGNVNANVPGVYEITYTATDPANNVAQKTRTVTVVDTTKPVITITGESSLAVECHTSYTDRGATANDECDGNVAVTPSGSVDVDIPGTYSITYTAIDAHGNTATAARTIEVVDTTKPVITLTGAETMTVECHVSFNDPGAVASDSCAGSFAATPSSNLDLNTPGTYQITYNGSDPSGNTATPVTRTVHVVDTTKPSISCPANITVPATPGSCVAPVTFTIGTSDSCDAHPILVVDRPSGSLFELGVTTVHATLTDASGNSSSCSFTVTVLETPTSTTLTLSAPTQQYSDPETLTATVTNSVTNTPVIGGTVTFRIGGSTVGTAAVDASGIATLSLQLIESTLLAKADLSPGPHTVTATYNGDAACYNTSIASQTLNIAQEDARVLYTGLTWIPACTNNSANATLSATVKDISIVEAQTAVDTTPGLITNAKLKFVNRETGAVLCTSPIGLADPSDKQTGTAACNATLGVGDYHLGVIVEGFYTRNDADEDDQVLEVATSCGTGFVTGGGHLVLATPAGEYKGDIGSKNNFGFNIKYNRKQTSLIGSINTIIRKNGRLYRVKGNAMTSLVLNTSVTQSHPYRTATFYGKASIQDVTDPLNPISLPNGGGAILRVTLTDTEPLTKPGESVPRPGIDPPDTIGITIWYSQAAGGGLFYSSNWNGSTTVEQPLGAGSGGNLQVH